MTWASTAMSCRRCRNKKISKITLNGLEYKPSPSLLESIIKYKKEKVNIDNFLFSDIWENKELKGGLYGIALGRVFFAESMFSKSANGSKIALIVLMGMLELNKFEL